MPFFILTLGKPAKGLEFRIAAVICMLHQLPLSRTELAEKGGAPKAQKGLSTHHQAFRLAGNCPKRAQGQYPEMSCNLKKRNPAPCINFLMAFAPVIKHQRKGGKSCKVFASAF
jgi:hypothetical protein